MLKSVKKSFLIKPPHPINRKYYRKLKYIKHENY